MKLKDILDESKGSHSLQIYDKMMNDVSSDSNERDPKKDNIGAVGDGSGPIVYTKGQYTVKRKSGFEFPVYKIGQYVIMFNSLSDSKEFIDEQDVVKVK